MIWFVQWWYWAKNPFKKIIIWVKEKYISWTLFSCLVLKLHFRKRRAGSKSTHVFPTFNEEVSARKEHYYCCCCCYLQFGSMWSNKIITHQSPSPCPTSSSQSSKGSHSRFHTRLLTPRGLPCRGFCGIEYWKEEDSWFLLYTHTAKQTGN